jgi:hypothetical protein
MMVIIDERAAAVSAAEQQSSGANSLNWLSPSFIIDV